MLYRRTITTKDKLKRLIDCNDKIQQKLKTLAIQDKITFFIIRERDGQPHSLHSGAVEKIYNAHPQKTHIIIEPHPSIPSSQTAGWNQVWVNIDDEKKLLEEDSATNIPDVLKHRTPLLDIMYKAIEKFWVNHDPDHPPKSDEVVDWLCDQKIATRNALVIDTIIRPTHLKLGGNRSRKSKKR